MANTAEFDITPGDLLQRTDDASSRWRVEDIDGDDVHLSSMADDETRKLSRNDVYANFSKITSA